jgi:hypothetical protein
MRVTRIVEVQRIGHESLLAFGIDSPQDGEVTAGYDLDVRGWAIGRSHAATAVEFLHDGVLLRRQPVDIERPDVSAAHGGAPEGPSGYFASLGTLGLSPQFDLLVRARLEDKTRAPLATLRGSRPRLQTSFEPRVRPLLLTTLGRTGSTAVVRLLGSHPEVVAYRPFEYEPRIATYWIGVLKALAEPASSRRQITPSGPIDGNWWLGADGPTPRPIKDAQVQAWLGTEAVEALATFCQSRIDDLYMQIAPLAGRPEPTYFVEKFRPDSVPLLVSELYPDAREILLVRDFRDMLASMFAYNERRGIQGFRREDAQSDVDYVLDRVRGSVDALAGAWRARSAGAHLLRYEDLVLRPAETVEALLGHLGLDAPAPTVAAMLASIGTADTDAHRTISDPKETIGRWRSDLSPELREVCREALGPSLQLFGYTDDDA